MHNPVPRVADHHVLCFSHASLGGRPRSANPLLAVFCNLRECPLRQSTTAPLSSPSERERETACARARTRAWFSWETESLGCERKTVAVSTIERQVCERFRPYFPQSCQLTLKMLLMLPGERGRGGEGERERRRG